MERTDEGWENWERQLFPARGLPGGGQLEIRMTISAEQPDPDILRVARRLKPYNLESWYTEWTAVAEKNAELAEEFERQGARVTAHEHYRRATDFYRRPLLYMAESDPRMLPTYHLMQKMWEKAWCHLPLSACRSRTRDICWTGCSTPSAAPRASAPRWSTTMPAPTGC